MTQRYIVALDQGTTSSRAVLVGHDGNFVDSIQREFKQIYPQPGWVEHNPQDILFTQLGSMAELLTKHHIDAKDIEGIGITNQRETTVIWDRATGEPVYNAIVWQCRRGAQIIDELCSEEEVRERIKEKTGLRPDPYFSASKIRWILDNVEGVRERAERGELAFGTVDCWLIWNLTDGRTHATDVTNASRTMLYNIVEGRWDQELLQLFNIPASLMPEVKPSASDYGVTLYPKLPAGIPICGVAGDQQSALFGQCCFKPGQAKNTYGTGCFLLMNTGSELRRSEHGLVTTIAASAPGCARTEYALEGSVFIAGALIQWLRDELGLVQTAGETEFLATSVEDTGGVYIVPAFTGLGAPYWEPKARGLICGLTRGSGRAQIVRAALEANAYQLYDLMTAMQADAGVPLTELNVDGGASENNFLLQFQSDLLGCRIRRPQNVETTALGAAYLAGLQTGFWSGTDELCRMRADDDVFEKQMDDGKIAELLAGWKDAVQRTV